MKIGLIIILGVCLFVYFSIRSKTPNPEAEEKARLSKEKYEELIKEEKKEEPKMEKASDEEKNSTIKSLEAQKAIELEIPNLKDADKESIEKKYANLIAQVKEDKIDKAEVIKLGKAAENYIKNVKESRGEKTEEKK